MISAFPAVLDISPLSYTLFLKLLSTLWEKTMKMITAFVRTTSLENIVKSLQETGITGMSVSEVRGVGEQVGLFTPFAVHNMMNIIVPDENVGTVTDIILRHAHTGLPGDGLIAVLPLDGVIEIRKRERIT